MKILITSPDAIIDNETNSFFDGIENALDHFCSLYKGNEVVVISLNSDKLDNIPDKYTSVLLSGAYRKYRGSPKLIDAIAEQTNIEHKDMLVLGAKNHDLYFASNSKLILLAAHYAASNNPECDIFTKGYGIGIFSPERLRVFMDTYMSVEDPWFFKLNVSDRTTMYGLTDANTFYQNNYKVVDICNKLKEFLKNGAEENRSPFYIYSLMSIHRIQKEIGKIDYWGYYPSSDVGENEELNMLKEIMRKSISSCRTTDNVLLRAVDSNKRRNLTAEARANDGCNSQFDSIIVNPRYRNKIQNKTICIIDDFTNHGSSCETTRHLLEHLGAARVIFIALGKYRFDYKRYHYTIDGNLFQLGYNYQKHGTYETVRGEQNNNSSKELLTALKEVLC